MEEVSEEVSEEGGERGVEEPGAHATGAEPSPVSEMERVRSALRPTPLQPTAAAVDGAAETIAAAAATGKPPIAVKRSASFSRPKGDKLAQKIDDSTTAEKVAVKRSNSFGRRGAAKPAAAKPAAAPQPEVKPEDASPAAAPRVGRSSSFARRGAGAVKRSSSFSKRGAGLLSDDVTDGGRRANLIAQRLQRARSSSGQPPEENDEVGCQVHPI